MEVTTEPYYLFRENDQKVVLVEPINKNENRVNNLTGAFFSDDSKIMTDKEVLHFKQVHNLFYESELKSQMNIFDLGGF